jgi:hypothetical protein
MSSWRNRPTRQEDHYGPAEGGRSNVGKVAWAREYLGPSWSGYGHALHLLLSRGAVGVFAPTEAPTVLIVRRVSRCTQIATLAEAPWTGS